MIAYKILVLKQDAKVQSGMEFKSGTEFHIVMDVVYMQGFPLSRELQPIIMGWISRNPKLFKEIFR